MGKLKQNNQRKGEQTMINWSKITKEESQIIHRVAVRAIKAIPRLKVMDIEMDISAAHIKRKLDLNKLSNFPDFDFAHDIVGISNNINRATGILENCFLPRCSA